jgi:hypothetical protein
VIVAVLVVAGAVSITGRAAAQEAASCTCSVKHRDDP